MTIVIPYDIAYEIARCAYYMDRMFTRNLAYRKILPQLKGTSQSFRHAADAILFRNISIWLIDSESLAQMDLLSKSPSICSSIRGYSFKPYLFPSQPHQHQRRIHKHCFDYFDPCFLHKQLQVMDLSEVESEAVRRRPHQLSRSRLKSTSYFNIIPRLSNLRWLEFAYSVQKVEYCDTLHDLWKDEISEGLGFLLVTSLLRLDNLLLHGPSLTDLEQLVSYINKAAAQPTERRIHQTSSKISFLKINLFPETSSHKGREINCSPTVSAHLDAGKSLQHLLTFLPDIKDLELRHTFNGTCRHKILLLQHFNPPPYPTYKTSNSAI